MSILDTFSLDGKTALITGGAGIVGKQIVRALVEAGAHTYVASRNLASLEELAQEFATEGLTIHPRQLDQADEGSIHALRDTIVSEQGTLEILVNNAVLRPMKDGYQDTAESFDASMKVNATGLFLLTRAMGDVMAEHRGILEAAVDRDADTASTRLVEHYRNTGAFLADLID